MGIFRGVGGTGDSTDDGVVDAVTEQAVIATNKATEAATSATNAYNSAQSASTSKDTAITQANAAQASANTASTHASNASTSATSAASSATSATASATTATTKASEASTSATNAATSETNAATSASTATTKASEAATSATTATTKAGEASTSATNAAASATSASTSASTATTKASEAATSAANAASSYDDFDDRYLGAKSSAPSTDNDGDALVTGALYFDTSSNAMKVWSGSSWLDAYASLSGALIATNNLSDLNNAGTARTNLGLGTAATTASTDYATAAQGTTADNALPKSGGAMTGAITTNSTFDGRDVSADGTKLDGIEAGATADQTAAEIKTAYESNADTNAFTDADHTKLDGIEASADVTDTANVTAAGALMDSELTSEASVKALNQGVATTDSPTFAGLTVDTNTLYVDSTNNRVGIGTSSPAESIHTTGNIRLGDSAPAELYSNSSELRFGVDKNNDNGTSNITFYVDNSEKVRIDSSGRVGIGTTSPDTLLTVADDTADQIKIGDTTDTNFWSLRAGTNFIVKDNDVEKMRIDSSGNVGIGTSSPAQALDVVGVIKVSDGILNAGAGGSASVFNEDGTTADFRVESSGNTHMLFVDGGLNRVGIGTSSPNYELSVHETSANADARIHLTNADTGTTTADGFQIIMNGNNASKQVNLLNREASPMAFWTSNSERMRIDSSGVVTIGGNTVWHAGNDGSGSGLDADTVDGKQVSQLYRLVGSANGTAGAGWITVAQCTSSRYHGEVFVTDGESGDHSFIRIDWMRSYADTAFTVLNCGGHSNRITGVRVLNESANTTYGTKKLQVYVTTSSNYYVRIHSTGEVSHYGNFTAVTPVVQNTITGYAVQGATIDDLDDSTLATHQGLRSGNGCDIRWSANSNTAKARFINEDGLNDTWIGIGGYNGVNRIESGYGFSGGSADLQIYGGLAGELARITTGKRLGLNKSSPDYYVDSYFPNSNSTQFQWRFTGPYGGSQCRSYYGIFFIGSSSTAGHGLGFSSSNIYPAEADNGTFYNDNVMDLGHPSARWDDVYATNGTIQTSDEREKQDIEALSDAEQRVAIAAKGLLRKFRWKDAVEEKGDNARTHFGIIAQDLQAAFEAEGLDHSKYAMFIKSEWWIGDKTHPAIDTVLDDEGNVMVEGSPEHIETDHHYDNEEDAPSDATYHYRLGIRYSELLAFIIASI